MSRKVEALVATETGWASRLTRPPERFRRRWLGVLALTVSTLAGVTACERAGDPVDPTPGRSAVAIQVVSGGGQRAFTGAPLREPIVFRALGADGLPVAGAVMNFVSTAGSGWVEPERAIANQDGDVAVAWTIGPVAGAQTLLISTGLAATAINAYAIDLETELDVLFVPPTADEIATIRADWAGRDVSPAGVTVELTEPYGADDSPATLRVVSHRVGEVRHFGAIIAPDSAAAGSLPVLMYLHGGDDGVDLNEVGLLSFALGELRDSFVYVIPSFRSESLEYGDRVWVSTGPSGHWDYDVDDALALLSVALDLTPQARPEGLSVLGISRGAGVALLAGIRDERIARIVPFFGPTDFFDDWVRDLLREVIQGFPRDLPGIAHLDSTVVEPYFKGRTTLADARLEMVRRSSVLFAEDLPSVQLHHGDVDGSVAVSQAHSLIRAMEALGRGPPDFEPYIYEGAGHDLFAMGGAIPRVQDFLRRALGDG